MVSVGGACTAQVSGGHWQCAGLVGGDGNEKGERDQPDADPEKGRHLAKGRIVRHLVRVVESLLDRRHVGMREMLVPQVVVQHCQRARQQEERVLELDLREPTGAQMVHTGGGQGDQREREREPIDEPEQHQKRGHHLGRQSERFARERRVFLNEFREVVEPCGDRKRHRNESEDRAQNSQQLHNHLNYKRLSTEKQVHLLTLPLFLLYCKIGLHDR